MTNATRASVIFLCVLGSLGVERQAAAQGRRANPEALVEAGVSPAEIQRMFDSYALMQAQDQLKITDDQFPQFLSRFKTLQDTRRRALNERARRVQQLRQMLNLPQPPDEAQVKDALKALQDADAAADADVKKAYDAVDQVLNTVQRAKFRVFEENMERRKLELVTRARQANRKQQQ